MIRSYYIISCLFLVILSGCHDHTGHAHGDSHDDHSHGTAHDDHDDHHGENEVHLTHQQVLALDMKVDTLSLRNLTGVVEVNGRLEVPPQNKAAVTSMIGANVASIRVIEGDEVRRGQVLAWLQHPELIRLQSDYASRYSRLSYLEQEYQRHKKLYEEKVGSGQEYQRAEADFKSAKGLVKGLEAQLKLYGLDPEKIREGEIFDRVPLRSPISGFVNGVNVKTGQYVEPQKELFEVINNHHVHVDLMVFERDIHKVKKGQKVRFRVESLPEKEIDAVIYAVGKSFEEDPKAVHIHAEIQDKSGMLLPGMYATGEIMVEGTSSIAVPEDALVEEGGKTFVFTARQENDSTWVFVPEEVRRGLESNGWVEVRMLGDVSRHSQYAFNNAFYLMAEMKKSEAEHVH